jgi:hypothetical protein
MAAHALRGDVQAVACWTLVNLSLNPSCKARLLRKGGLPLILNALQAHPCHHQVQFRGLFALINLVVPDAPPQAKTPLVEVTAADIAVSLFVSLSSPLARLEVPAVLLCFPAVSFFLFISLSVSFTLSTGPLVTLSHPWPLVLSPARARSQEVVEHVLCAVERFLLDPKLVNRGCLVLQNLSLNSHNHPALCHSRARHTLAAVVGAHPHTDPWIVLSAQATALRLFGEYLAMPALAVPALATPLATPLPTPLEMLTARAAL